MTDDATPAKVRLTDGLGPLLEPTVYTNHVEVGFALTNPGRGGSFYKTASGPSDVGLWTIDRIDLFVSAAVAAERERCAKLCEEVESQAWALWKTTADPIEQGRNIGAQHCADAIRA